jgi:hypothetical protein
VYAFWHSYAGGEVYAANPGLVDGLEGRIQEMMATGYFHLPKHVELDLSHGVQKDPFKSLPFDILVSIAEMLEDPECFMNWARAILVYPYIPPKRPELILEEDHTHANAVVL